MLGLEGGAGVVFVSKRLLAGSDQSPFRLGVVAISETALSPASAAALETGPFHG